MLFCLPSPVPDAVQPDGGGNEQDAHSHAPATAAVCQPRSQRRPFPPNGKVHGVVHTRAGNQRKNRHHQVGNGGYFRTFTGHFLHSRRRPRSPEAGCHIRAAQIQSQPVNAPTEDSAHSTEQAAGAVDVKMMEKPIQPVRQAMHSMKKECTKVAALTGMGSSIPATFQAAPVPNAMAIAIRITCTTLFVPELVSRK